MRFAFVCALLCACASGSKEAARQPSNAPAAEAKAAPEAASAAAPAPASAATPSAAPAQPGTHGPMTAAEAAAAAAQRQGAAGDAPPAAASDDAPCAADDDCTFTRLAPGACCPLLCMPRAVTKKGAEALEAHERSCGMGPRCPQPMCAPPRQLTYPACVQGRCVSKAREGTGPQ